MTRLQFSQQQGIGSV
jgi:hypothetical protein